MSALLLALTLCAAPVNLVPNADFAADPAGWNLPRQVALDTTVGHGDQRSLKFVNTDAKAYPMATYPLALVPGRLYRFSAWVKTQGVVGDESGATTCLEYSGPKGWLGGAWPAGRKGDQDWYQVVSDVTLPPEATASHLTLYLRRGCTGTAWFDDVEVIEVLPPPLRAYLERPNYRGRVPAGADLPDAVVRVLVGHTLEGDLAPADTKLELSLRRGDKVLATSQAEPTTTRASMKLKLGKLEPGRHELRLRLLAKRDGRQLAEWTAPIEAYDPKAKPLPVDIDGEGFCRVNGQRYFPLGLYLGNVKPEELARIAAGGFNTIMPYNSMSGDDAAVKARLDAVAAAKLKIIFSIKDLYAGMGGMKTAEAADARAEHLVTTQRNHPAVLAWYLNDELPVSVHDQLAARYRRIAEIDPNHPTWSVLYQVNQLEHYLDTADVLGTDPYPIGRAPAAMAGEWTTTTAAAKGPWGPIWQVPQAHDWANYEESEAGKAKGRAPTRDEMRTMTYQCLAAGAKGLIYYSWFDLQRDKLGFEPRWQDMCIIADEVNNLVPWLLSSEAAPELKLAPSNLKTVYARAWQTGGKTLVIAANGAAEPGRVGWTLPAGRAVRRLSGDATWDGDGIALAGNGAVALVLEAQ